MLSTNQNLFKLCLLMAVLAAYTPVGFAQQVLVLPSKAIDISEPDSFSEENSISISTQSITVNENLIVSISVNLDVVPNLSAPVIKVDDILYATDGDLIYKKETNQSSWKIADRSEQPQQLTGTKSVLPETECNCEPGVLVSESLNRSGDFANQIQLPVQSLASSSEVKPLFSFTELPTDFPFQFSDPISSVFIQNETTERLDVVLGNNVQISFIKEGNNWITIDWLVLDNNNVSALSNKNSLRVTIHSDGFLPGSFTSFRTFSYSTPILLNKFSLNLADLGFVPPVNHIASGWSPTLGAVYDRNVGFNLIFCSNLQTFSSFYTATLNFDNSYSRPTGKYPLSFAILIEKSSLSGRSTKGTLI